MRRRSIHATNRDVARTGRRPHCGQSPRRNLSGPPKGTLILDGCKAAEEWFVSLAGGPERNFVYIPTGASAVRMDGLATAEPRPDALYIPPERSIRLPFLRMGGVVGERRDGQWKQKGTGAQATA
jgi:hypothetical protein